MHDPTFMSQVTAALHEDRLRSLQRDQNRRRLAPHDLVRQVLRLDQQPRIKRAASSGATCECAVASRG